MKNALTGLLFAILLSVVATNLPGCSRSKTRQPAAAGALPNEPDVTFKDLAGKDSPAREPEGEGCTRKFLGHLVRALPDRDSLDDRIPAKIRGQGLHHARCGHG